MKWANERKFDLEIAGACEVTRLPIALVKGLIATESGFNPNAIRGEVRRADSSIGLMQLLYSTAQSLGYKGEPSGLFDPLTNIQLGTELLADNLRRTGGDVQAALSMYNGGFRPQFAFGVRATTPGKVCLARNQQTGDCISWYSYKVGEFGNQPYVDKVLTNAAYFGYDPTFSDVSGGGSSPAGGGETPGPSAAGKVLPFLGGLLSLALAAIGLRRRRRTARRLA